MSHVDHMAVFHADRPALHASMRRASDNPQGPETTVIAAPGASGPGGDKNGDNATFGRFVTLPSVVPDGARPRLGYRRAVQ